MVAWQTFCGSRCRLSTGSLDRARTRNRRGHVDQDRRGGTDAGGQRGRAEQVLSAPQGRDRHRVARDQPFDAPHVTITGSASSMALPRDLDRFLVSSSLRLAPTHLRCWQRGSRTRSQAKKASASPSPTGASRRSIMRFYVMVHGRRSTGSRACSSQRLRRSDGSDGEACRRRWTALACRSSGGRQVRRASV